MYACTHTGPLSNLRKNEMHLGKQPKLINHGNPVSSFCKSSGTFNIAIK